MEETRLVAQRRCPEDQHDAGRRVVRSDRGGVQAPVRDEAQNSVGMQRRSRCRAAHDDPESATSSRSGCSRRWPT